ncbi:MAG: glycoside hydrolase family 44 protein [Terracidiphilus sp.]
MLHMMFSFFLSIVRTIVLSFSGDAARARGKSLRLQVLPAALRIAFISIAAAQLSAQNAATSVNVDAAANQHAINPNIYGLSVAGQSDIAALNAPLNRLGGETLASTYNWQIDALNLSHDWYWESFLQDSPQTPGAAVDKSIQGTYGANVGSEPMVSIPMMPYIASLGPNPTTDAASLWSYSVKKYGAQEYDSIDNLNAADPYQPDAGAGISAATGKEIVNNPLDAYVPNTVAIQSAWLQHLIGKWGSSTTSTGVKYYILDNEPSLWASTHRDIHPNPETYDEEYNDIVSYATAIRAADPNAKIVAPEEWVWWAMYESGLDQENGTGAGSDYATHNDTYFYPWLLQQLYAYQRSQGTKLIDMLSVHCYNQTPDKSDDSATGQATRNRETRILWDPTFVDLSWQANLGINGGVEDWIPLMRSWVNQYYPGLEIGCTEYNWGDEAALNGATTQADVEGIYGVYGFDFATRWTVPANPSPTYLAMEMYRNYDGKLSTFGDTSVSATVANPDNLSAFAATRSSDNALTVMVINKQQGSTPVTVSLANFANTGTALAYQVSSATQASITSLSSVTVANNAISATVPSQSITLFVIPAGSVESAPTAPTGLAATVGNGIVTLTWNAGGGATSYDVQRGAASGGPFTKIGTVTNPAPTSYTDTGLTNGTTYYYVVSGTNSVGTSPNSAPVAATPLVPPTFNSSATASPNPVTQNVGTTITATVKCTANSLSNGTVQMIALDPNGSVALTQSFTAQNFATNQTQSYTATLTPTLAGTYTVEVGVLSATGQQWSLNTTAGTITVDSALTFTSSATANPTSITASGSSTVSVTVKDTGTIGLTNGIVQLLVIDPSGTQIVQQNWTGENFTANGTLPLTYVFTPSSLLPPATTTGTYTVDIGVFNSTWSTDYYWSSNATTITMTSGALQSQTITFAQPTSPVTYKSGLTIPLTATGGGSGNPVVFTLDASSTGTGTISGNTLTVTGAGNLVIDANQAGNASYSAAAQVQRTVVVTALTAQTITFAPPTSPVTYKSGLTIPLSATGGGSGNPVVFTLDSSSAGTGSISGSTLTVTGAGNLIIDANQTGNASYLAAPQVQRTVVVNALTAQTITFTQPTSPLTYKSSLTIPLVATGGGSGNPVVFTLDSSSTDTGTISGNTLTVTGVGNLVIDANQTGNASYSAAPQVQRTVVVNAAATPDFVISTTPTSLSSPPGGSTNLTVAVAATGGAFSSAVTLSVSGLPTGATATFSPASVTPGSSTASSQLTIQTATLTGIAVAPRSAWPVAAPALSLLGLIFIAGKCRRRWLALTILLFTSLGAISALSGCSGSLHLTNNMPPPQSYTLTVTGTSGTDAHSTTVQFTVQ